MKAASLCSGDLVFLADQDDVWFAEKIATVVRLFQDAPLTMVVLNDAMLVDARLKWNGRTQLSNVRGCGLPDTHFNFGSCSAHRRC